MKFIKIAMLTMVFGISFCSATKEADVTLLRIGGKVAITENDFNESLTRIIEMNPYFRGASLESLPLNVKKQVFDELIKQELILAEAYKNKLEESEEFKKALKSVKKSILAEVWAKNILKNIKVEDSEIAADFEKNKDKYIKKQEEISVCGIKFDTDLKAVAFLNKVKDKLAQFNDLAKQENAANFTNFGRVSEEMKNTPANNIPAEIKKKALTLATVPAVEKVQVGKNFWVIYVSDKKDKELFVLEEIKPQLKEMLKANKFKTIFEEKLKALQNTYKPEINEEYFNQPEAKPVEK